MENINNFKILLITPFQLPYHTIGSWTKMYDYFMVHNQSVIDYIMCPKPILPLHKNCSYYFADRLPFERYSKKIVGYKFYNYLQELKRILKNEKKLVIKIIDNVGLLLEVDSYLKKIKRRNDVKILFFIHGYSYFLEQGKNNAFYQAIDHIIYLTQTSYQFELNRNSVLYNEVSILPNGIDSDIFYKLDDDNKSTLKKQNNLENKIVLLWLANERPKKGLSLFLKAFKNSILYNNNNFQLLIVGTTKYENDSNIQYIGKIPNNETVTYYQLSDYYFFTTLCHEGLPLSLIEAYKCGCTCFASDIDPLQEVTMNGKIAHLVTNPNIISSWIAVLNAVANNKIKRNVSTLEDLNTIYTIEDWSKNLKDLLLKEKYA